MGAPQGIIACAAGARSDRESDSAASFHEDDGITFDTICKQNLLAGQRSDRPGFSCG